jgi:hypothetical protein
VPRDSGIPAPKSSNMVLIPPSSGTERSGGTRGSYYYRDIHRSINYRAQKSLPRVSASHMIARKLLQAAGSGRGIV